MNNAMPAVIAGIARLSQKADKMSQPLRQGAAFKPNTKTMAPS
jgi:hypothetical protein